jgi:hypothetical protein
MEHPKDNGTKSTKSLPIAGIKQPLGATTSTPATEAGEDPLKVEVNAPVTVTAGWNHVFAWERPQGAQAPKATEDPAHSGWQSNRTRRGEASKPRERLSNPSLGESEGKVDTSR